MSKGRIILISILLITSAAIIHFYVKGENAKQNLTLIEFFTGFIFGIGIVTLLLAIFETKNKE